MDEELKIPKGTALKQLIEEDLEVHSIETLNNRLEILKSEIRRTQGAIKNKKSASDAANSIFKRTRRITYLD
jgi:uncharacterized small protein (DUF1192 family)